jgi:hypothetical protein
MINPTINPIGLKRVISVSFPLTPQHIIKRKEVKDLILIRLCVRKFHAFGIFKKNLKFFANKHSDEV